MKLSIIKILFFYAATLAAAAALAAPAVDTWEFFLERGKREYETMMYMDAVLSLRRALDLNAESVEAANALAATYLAMRDREMALETYERSLAIRGDQADIHNRTGELCDELFDERRAFDHYLEAVRLNPSHPGAHMNLVRHYLRKGDRKSAEEHFQKSQELAREKSGGSLARAESARTPDEAIRLYAKIIEETPSLVDAYFGLCEAYRKKRDFPAAAAALERVKRIKPDHEKALVMLGNLYFTEKFHGPRMRYLGKAEKNLSAALKVNPDNYSALYTLSRVYRFMGKKKLAAETLEKAMSAEKRVSGK